MKSFSLIGLLWVLMVSMGHAQVGQEAGIGIFVGGAVSDHIRTTDDFKGRYNPDRSRVFYGGVSFCQPIRRFLGSQVEIGWLQNRRNYVYTTDQVSTSVESDETYYSILISPSLTLNPLALRGFFVRAGLPLSVAFGNSGTYKLVHSDFVNPPVTIDYSDQVADYRTGIYARVEGSIGYLFTWGKGSGVWVRGTIGRSMSRFWRTSFRATPEQPRLAHMSIELGFRFGTPGMRLFKAAYKPIDPSKPPLKQRMKDQPWNNQ